MFPVRVTLRNLTQPDRRRDLDLMVDAARFLRGLIRPSSTRQFRTIAGPLIERKVGFALIAWNGRSGSINVKTLVPTVAMALTHELL